MPMTKLVKVQSVVCDDAMLLKRSNRGLKRSPLQRSDEYWSSNCYCLCKGYKHRNNKQSNCCCLHQVVNIGTHNCGSNKLFNLN